MAKWTETSLDLNLRERVKERCEKLFAIYRRRSEKVVQWKSVIAAEMLRRPVPIDRRGGCEEMWKKKKTRRWSLHNRSSNTAREPMSVGRKCVKKVVGVDRNDFVVVVTELRASSLWITGSKANNPTCDLGRAFHSNSHSRALNVDLRNCEVQQMLAVGSLLVHSIKLIRKIIYCGTWMMTLEGFVLILISTRSLHTHIGISRLMIARCSAEWEGKIDSQARGTPKPCLKFHCS